MSRLISQGGYGCVYHPGFDIKKPEETNEDIVVKLQQKSAAASNELYVSKIITTIPHYLFYFAPIIKTDTIRIGKLKKSLLKGCKVITKEVAKKYMLMSIPYVNKENYFESLTNRVDNDTRRILVQFIDSYTFLLKSLELLIDKEIVHMDIKDDNVVYNRQFKNPIIIDFGISVSIKNLQQKQWSKMFYIYAPEYYIWPLDIHFICYLLHENDVLTEEDIALVCDSYIDTNPIFHLFSPTFRSLYVEGAKEYYSFLISRSLVDNIKQLLQYWQSWDNYALTILNIRYMSYMFSNKYIVNNFTQSLSELLLTNIHYNPALRLSVIDTRYSLKQLTEKDMTIEDYIEMRKHMSIKDTSIKTKLKNQFISRSDKVN